MARAAYVRMRFARADGYGMPGVAVDGADAEAVFGAVREALARARAGDGPTLIEARVHRAGPHSTTDDPRLYGGNVTAREQPLRDPVRRLRRQLCAEGQWNDTLDAQLSAQRRERRGGRVRLPKRRKPPRAPRLTEAAPAVPDRRGEARRENLASAVRPALDDALTEQDDVVMLGEDIGRLGGVFRVTEGLLERHGEGRVIDTPICESGFTGAAVGLAIAGMRPVVEIQFGGFLYPAHDQLRSHAARIRTRTRATRWSSSSRWPATAALWAWRRRPAGGRRLAAPLSTGSVMT
jgi:hypothetical protein